MGRYLKAFQDLLRKATQPLGQQGPKLTAPASISPKPATMPSEADHVNHERKDHYKTFGEAQAVVDRSKKQNPSRQFDLHAYPCPVCQQHIVGHKTKYNEHDWRNNIQPLTAGR